MKRIQVQNNFQIQILKYLELTKIVSIKHNISILEEKNQKLNISSLINLLNEKKNSEKYVKPIKKDSLNNLFDLADKGNLIPINHFLTTSEF